MVKFLQSFFNMEREHTVYLTSTGNLDIFPNNNPCEFVNRLSAPITLDPKYEYEIGLVSYFFFFYEWEHRTGTMCPFSSLHPLKKGKEV